MVANLSTVTSFDGVYVGVVATTSYQRKLQLRVFPLFQSQYVSLKMKLCTLFRNNCSSLIFKRICITYLRDTDLHQINSLAIVRFLPRAISTDK